MTTHILGISAYYHDSAAALISDGSLVAAAQEERFTRKKHDPSFPKHATRFVLEEGGIGIEGLTAVAFYDKPLLKFERLLETYHADAPHGLSSFVTTMPVWIKEKLFLKKVLRDALGMSKKIPLFFAEHHQSHAASAFYPSPFGEAAILTIDGVGEWATTTICQGKGDKIKIFRELRFPHSLGLLYSAFTYYLGFKVNSGEYKVMGLAPYGDSRSSQTQLFTKKILSELIDLRKDGSFLINMDYFDYASGLKMTNNERWKALFGIAPRTPESDLQQPHMDLAHAVQEVTDMIVVSLARTAQSMTGSKNLVMAGGVALNCVSNARLAAAKIFEHIWIQPAAGDAGGALGAACAAVCALDPGGLKKSAETDGMHGSLLGPAYSSGDIERVMRGRKASFDHYEDLHELTARVARYIADGKVVGWFQGKMEFGPRALGNRSILADPRNPEMQKKLNLKIKFREAFRPFAPSVLEEDAAMYFNGVGISPYMLFTASLKDTWKTPEITEDITGGWRERLAHGNSVIPAVTHVDYSARLQTVRRETNPLYWQLIHDFKEITGLGMLINTSFNRRGEPMVCSPGDAYTCFMGTDMDYLVMGSFVMDKKKQVPGENVSGPMARKDQEGAQGGSAQKTACGSEDWKGGP